MLSTAAWNAFLKTLEEPPPNTVFVLATTEAGRSRRRSSTAATASTSTVPPSSRSRASCGGSPRPRGSRSRRRPSARCRARRPAASATRSARSSSSSPTAARRSPSQMCSPCSAWRTRSCSTEVDLAAVRRARQACLQRSRRCSEQGRDAASLAGDLEVRARELLVVQTLGGVPAELSLTPEADAALGEQAGRVDRATVVRLLELLGEAMEAVRAGADARTRLELALVKAARPETDGSLRALLARIERLEAADRRGGPARRLPRRRSRRAAAPGDGPRASVPARAGARSRPRRPRPRRTARSSTRSLPPPRPPSARSPAGARRGRRGCRGSRLDLRAPGRRSWSSFAARTRCWERASPRLVRWRWRGRS